MTESLFTARAIKIYKKKKPCATILFLFRSNSFSFVVFFSCFHYIHNPVFVFVFFPFADFFFLLLLVIFVVFN